ncbi:MAG: formimidoylglutamate deiminase [Planctomycetota bacterium]
MTTYEAALTWTGRCLERGMQIEVAADGRIGAVGNRLSAEPVRLDRFALLPGFVNAHSHAFQRGLRGRGETFPDNAGSFWTWREAMYNLVDSLDVDKTYALSKRAFDEMLAAGITTVGEFQYVHHNATGEGFALDDAVIRAAHDAGIRLCLLQTYYRTGGIGKTLEGGQRRFATPDPETYWAQIDRLQSGMDDARQSIGVVAHSIRAVPLDDLVQLHEESQRRGCVFHMHLEEQPQEIKDCVDRYGMTPLRVVNEHLSIDPRFTAVHCTHTADADMDEFLAAGGHVCICPLTEANLGDGVAHVPGMVKRGGSVCIGTDSNSRISFTEEIRWLEYVQRVVRQERGSLRGGDGDVARPLFEMATVHGAQSLGVRAGRLDPGAWADLQLIDLDHAALHGWTEDTLLTSYLLGTGNEAIANTCVGGQWIKPLT